MRIIRSNIELDEQGNKVRKITHYSMKKTLLGKLDDKEIDFIAVRGKEKLYIQVAYLLAEPATIEREFFPLETIDDNYPKMVISTDPVNRLRNGIIHMNIIDYLFAESPEKH